jgi:hypothetical protein
MKYGQKKAVTETVTAEKAVLTINRYTIQRQRDKASSKNTNDYINTGLKLVSIHICMIIYNKFYYASGFLK